MRHEFRDSIQFRQNLLGVPVGPINQNDSNVLRNYLKSKHLHVTAMTNGAPGLWAARGLHINNIREGGVSILCSHFHDDARFTGFNNKKFNYCPTGSWADWVLLAKRIIEVDESIQEFKSKL